MKIITCYDGYIHKFQNKYYFSEIDYLIVSRYLKVFGEIFLVLRTKEVEHLENFYSIPINDLRITIIEIPMFQGPIEYSKAFFKVRKAIKDAAFKAELGIFRLPSTIGDLMCKEFRKSNKKYLVEVVANPQEASSSINNIFIKYILKIVNKSLTKNCLFANGVSYVTKINLPDQYPPRNKKIEFYSSVELTEDFFYKDRTYKFKNKINILHVANNITSSDTKGNRAALYIINMILLKGYDVMLTFVGEKKDPQLFEDIIINYKLNKHVQFVGRKSKQELRAFMIKNDILLFPSLSEGLPRTIIEACAVGLPCVSSNVGGISELIPKDVIFGIYDYEGMANKIIEIMNNEDMYIMYSKMNLNTAMRYDSKILNNKRERFYKLLLED